MTGTEIAVLVGFPAFSGFAVGYIISAFKHAKEFDEQLKGVIRNLQRPKG